MLSFDIQWLHHVDLQRVPLVLLSFSAGMEETPEIKLCILLNKVMEGRESSPLDTQVHKYTKRNQVIACSGKREDQAGILKGLDYSLTRKFC